MRFILFILFIVMPFVEIALLIKLGDILGFWRTIGIVVATAIVGAYVLQAQGAATLRRVSQSMTSGEPPIKPVVDGFFLAISGAFLLTPGVVTDAIGLLLLVPPVRHAIARWGFGRIVKSGNFTVHTYQSGGAPNEPGARGGPDRQPGSRPGPSDGQVIDAEYEEVKNKKT
ncbi:MAG: FxsA family protein [Hyphomicrobiaceae bacterium]